MKLTELIERYLVVWVVLAAATGLVAPRLEAITRVSTLLLAVMVGSISLTLTVAAFRRIRPRVVATVLVGHAAMPLVALAIARLLGLSPGLTVGFVILGAVTPELVTPVVTELADGDTALSTASLVIIGLGSVAFVPAVVGALVPGLAVDASAIAEQLLVAVVVPMTIAVGARAGWSDAVGRYDAYYPSVSALMVLLVIAGVTAANASVIRAGGPLATVVAGALVLNAAGYGIGWLGLSWAHEPERIAGLFSVGMRDFAVAAALVTAAGLPPVAALPAVVFGVIELTSSAGLAGWFADR